MRIKMKAFTYLKTLVKFIHNRYMVFVKVELLVFLELHFCGEQIKGNLRRLRFRMTNIGC